jgi:hypothetical protein
MKLMEKSNEEKDMDKGYDAIEECKLQESKSFSAKSKGS